MWMVSSEVSPGYVSMTNVSPHVEVIGISLIWKAMSNTGPTCRRHAMNTSSLSTQIWSSCQLNSDSITNSIVWLWLMMRIMMLDECKSSCPRFIGYIKRLQMTDVCFSVDLVLNCKLFSFNCVSDFVECWIFFPNMNTLRTEHDK